MVQLDLTPDIEVQVFYLLFDTCHVVKIERSVKQHTKYLNFHCKIMLDHPVKV